MLGWLVYEHGIEPHVTVFDKSAHVRDVYRCPGGTALRTTRTLVNDGATMLYSALQRECAGLKPKCCPNRQCTASSRFEGRGTMDRLTFNG